MTAISLGSQKQIAEQFLKMVVSGQIEEAYDRYVDPQGKHHNAQVPAGFMALKKAMEENHACFPNMQLTIKHVIAEGDLVTVHARVVMQPGDRDFITFHLFRLQKNKITEFWDCGQPLSPDSPNSDGAL